MGKKSGAAKPYDPAAAARVRAEDRERRRDPGRWGISADTLKRANADGLVVNQTKQKREIYAKRLDPFEAMFRAGSLTIAQHQAAGRLFEDWCIANGIKTVEARPALDISRIEPRYGPSDLINARMIDARDRFEAAIKAVGRGTGAVLQALITPAVMCGSVVIWRAEVERVTGETHTHAQGAVVRRACEDLRLAYLELDHRAALRKIEAA